MVLGGYGTGLKGRYLVGDMGVQRLPNLVREDGIQRVSVG